MFIYVARHAWAGHLGDPGWDCDAERPLTQEGAHRFTNVVQALAGRGFAPTRIATSPYARCRQTAVLIARHTLAEPPIDELESLAPGADFEELMAWTRKRQGQDVCWVGHNPDVELLVASLIGNDRASIRFAKGTIASIKCDLPLDGSSRKPVGDLHWHVTAKALGL